MWMRVGGARIWPPLGALNKSCLPCFSHRWSSAPSAYSAPIHTCSTAGLVPPLSERAAMLVILLVLVLERRTRMCNMKRGRTRMFPYASPTHVLMSPTSTQDDIVPRVWSSTLAFCEPSRGEPVRYGVMTKVSLRLGIHKLLAFLTILLVADRISCSRAARWTRAAAHAPRECWAPAL